MSQYQQKKKSQQYLKDKESQVLSLIPILHIDIGMNPSNVPVQVLLH